MRSAAVDEYVTTKVLPQHQGIVDALRDLGRVRPAGPGGDPLRITGLEGHEVPRIISPSNAHITFAFERGAEFDDAHGLLDGSGKRTRHVKIRSLDALNTDALRDYIAQAVRLDGA